MTFTSIIGYWTDRNGTPQREIVQSCKDRDEAYGIYVDTVAAGTYDYVGMVIGEQCEEPVESHGDPAPFLGQDYSFGRCEGGEKFYADL